MKPSPFGVRNCLCGTVVAMVLAACGGGDEATTTPAPVPVATASDDAATVEWNVTSSLAVTANDTVANGTATVSVATPPVHGTAVADGTAIRYTPSAGYFGTDALTYTLTVGGQTSVATVHLAVAAKLTLSGVVSDGPLPGASVVANVGGKASAAVTADAAGAYSLIIESADPAAFVSLTATGAGAQSNVVLTSLVGDMSQAAAAAASGVVGAAALPAFNVTHVSTAVAVLTAQAIGKPPASAADVAAAQGLFSSTQTLEMATAIKLVVDAGVALPSGVSDTLTLVADPATFTAFVTAQASQNASLFAQAQQTVLTDSSVGFAPPTPTPARSTVSYWVVSTEGAGWLQGTKIVLQIDGSATVEDIGIHTARWSLVGNEIKITYAPPVEIVLDIGTEVQTISQTGLTLRQLGGTPGDGPVAATFAGSEKYFYVASGQSETYDTTATVPFEVVTTPMSFTAADVTIGTRWAGLLSAASSWTDGTPDQDVLQIITPTTASFEHSGQTVQYSLTTDGKLVLNLGGALYVYQRLLPGAQGEERWVGEKVQGGRLENGIVQGGSSQAIYGVAAYRAQPSFAPFTLESLAQRWQSYVNVGVVASKSYIDLSADGTATGVTIEVDGSQTPFSSDSFWHIDGAGLMVMQNSNSTRTWELLGVSGNRIYVLEYRGYYRLNVYTRQ